MIVVGIPLPELRRLLRVLHPRRGRAARSPTSACRCSSPRVITTALGVLARRASRPAAPCARSPTRPRPPRRSPAAASTPASTPTDDPDLGVLANSFNDMAAALQQRIERDARFASDVSHELRSPLMTLSASVEVMQARRDEMPERAQAALDLLVSDVGRFQGLVEDLLEISRFDAGAIRLHLEDLPGQPVRAQRRRRQRRRRDTPVTCTPRAERAIIHGDRRRLARVDRQPDRQRPRLRRRRAGGHDHRRQPARRAADATSRSPSRTTAPACPSRSGR